MVERLPRRVIVLELCLIIKDLSSPFSTHLSLLAYCILSVDHVTSGIRAGPDLGDGGDAA